MKLTLEERKQMAAELATRMVDAMHEYPVDTVMDVLVACVAELIADQNPAWRDLFVERMDEAIKYSVARKAADPNWGEDGL